MYAIHEKPGRLAASLALAVGVVLLLCAGCAHQPPPPSSTAVISTTFAQNVPHAVHQRIDMFSPSESVAIILKGLAAQWVTVSMHDAPTGRLHVEQTVYVPAHSDGAVILNPLRPGQYIVRASQRGVLKAESHFTVR